MLPFAAPTAERLKRVLVAGSLSPTPLFSYRFYFFFFSMHRGIGDGNGLAEFTCT